MNHIKNHQLPISSPLNYGACVFIFLIALALRMAVLPVEAGLGFLTFYPATIICFYICGTRPGILYTLLSGLTGYYIFFPPHWSFTPTLRSIIGLGAYFLFAWLVAEGVSLYRQTRISYEALLEDQTDLISRFLVDGKILYINDAYCKYFGIPREKLIGHHWHPVAHGDDVPMINQKLSQLTFDNPVVMIENRIFAKNGELRWAQFVNHGFFNENKELKEIQSVGRDITDRKQLEEKLRQLSFEQESMLENELVGIMKIKGRKILWINKGMERISGYLKSDLEGVNTRILYTDEDAYQNLGQTAYPILNSKGRYRTQIEWVKKGGERFWADLSGAMLEDGDGASLWMLVDFTELKQQERFVEHIAYHDILTGLPNRLLFSDRLQQAIAIAERSSQTIAVCFIDLDGFKPINDQYGHAAGDKVLIEVAQRMQREIRSIDTLSRFGGDEFVLLLSNLEHENEYQAVLARLAEEIKRPIGISAEIVVKVTASIGVSLYPTDSVNLDKLIRYADEAMYQAKAAGRNIIINYQSIKAID